MGTHPNAILQLTLKPDDLPMKTARALRMEAGLDADDADGQIEIDGVGYDVVIMAGTYDESFQVSADEGDIVLLDMVTYGYGARIEWSKLEMQKTALEKWAADACAKHQCKYQIHITANYW